MCSQGFNDIEKIKKMWKDHVDRYDDWYKTLRGAVENYVDWELLKEYLPTRKNAKILDAVGGTGGITLPLAKMGYSLTLCDISPEMLAVARKKMINEGVNDRVKLLESNIHDLPFDDESFDLTLCWNGGIEAARELIRVTKEGGMLSIFLNNKWSAIINNFYKDTDSTCALVKSYTSYLINNESKNRIISPEEAGEFFKKEGINVIDIYAVCN